MTATGATAARVLVPALLLGVAGDLLFYRASGLGLNAALWTAVTVAAWVGLRRRSAGLPAGTERHLLLAILAIAVGLVWRASPMLIFLDGVALLTLAVLLPFAARPELGVQLGRMRPGELLNGGVWLVRSGAAGLVPCVLDANRRPPAEPRAGLPVAAVLRGALLAAPVLLVFGGLLGTADPVFGSFLQELIRVDPERLAQHTVLLLGFSWLGAALLVRLVRPAPALPLGGAGAGAGTGVGLGPVEVGVLLGAVDLLFLAFVVFQLPYFFGDRAFVQRWSGGTLADYARRGFFELVALSALVLPLLLAVHARLAQGGALVVRLYRGLAAGEVALLLVIIASAMHRMALYQGQFGLTEDRFFASAFIGGLAVTSAWFALTMLRAPGGSRAGPARFVSGSLAAWGVWLALLHAVNPERVIVETNLGRAEAGRQLDVAHLASLSADALPALAAAWGRLAPGDRVTLRSALVARDDLRPPDWRSWNLARARAPRVIAALPQP